MTMADLGPNIEPERIVWLIDGNKEFDSTVALCSRQLAPMLYRVWPKVDQVLVTNTKGVSEFPGRTYCVKVPDGLKKWFREREIFVAALLNNVVQNADIVITTDMGFVLMTYVMDGAVQMLRTQGDMLRLKPIVFVSPKLPEAGFQDFVAGHGDDMFWYLIANKPNAWLAVLDNLHEEEYAVKELLKRQPTARAEKVLPRIVTYRFDGFKDGGVEKEDVVVWQGRNNTGKRPDLAAEVFALLAGKGIQCEMYIPTAGGGRTGYPEIAKESGFCRVFTNLDQNLYQQAICRAKAGVITSESESLSVGTLEQMERGVVPVIRRRKWNRGFVTERWPLVWTNTAEAAAMCEDVLQNYADYRKLLEECMRERYSAEPNFDRLMQKVWNDFAVSYYREFSLEK